MTVYDRSHPPYQPLLRALGAYLDNEGPARFKFVETPDGFTVVLDRGQSRPVLDEVHFPYDELIEQCERLVRDRRLLGSKYQGSWALSPSGRQDFLRALGYELDDSNVRAIVLDELDDAMLLTYSYMDPGQGYQWRKHMIVLREEQMDTIITAAHSRRHKRGLLKR